MGLLPAGERTPQQCIGHCRVDYVPLHFNTGHEHKYEDKKERAGSAVLREVILVAVVVIFFCFSSIVAAQHANRAVAIVAGQEGE